jgi:hypothetical protein
MRRALGLIVALGGCSDPSPGASVDIDGAATDMPDVSAVRIDTFYMLTARAADGAMLELGFPTSAVIGAHTCDEGRTVGLLTVTFTSGADQRFSSVYPIAAPANQCSFDLDERGSSIELSSLGAFLSDMTAASTVELANGSFRASVTQ